MCCSDIHEALFSGGGLFFSLPPSTLSLFEINELPPALSIDLFGRWLFFSKYFGGSSVIGFGNILPKVSSSNKGLWHYVYQRLQLISFLSGMIDIVAGIRMKRARNTLSMMEFKQTMFSEKIPFV